MRVYTNMRELSEYKIDGWEFEILNELKDCSNHKDENCLFHTRFLFEMDYAPLDEQWELVKKLKENITRVVYSGSKSLHTIIEFDPQYEEFCKDHYKQIWRLLNDLLFGGKCDTQCINPSRLTRTYGVVRASTGREQRLMYSCPGNYYKDAEKLVSMVNSSEIAQRIKTSLNAKPVYLRRNVDCSQWETITRYLETPFPQQTGNGHSSTWLYAALQATKKAGDMATQQKIIEKAKSEGWTDREIEHKLNG